MIRALALRSRILPFATATRQHFASPTWRLARTQSTAHASEVAEGKGFFPPMFEAPNKQRKLPLQERDPRKGQKDMTRSMPSSSVSRPRQPQSSPKHHRPAMNHDRLRGKKRKAEPPVDQPSARRHRPDSRPISKLKDETYVREHFKVPSQADYPNLPSGIFRNPKDHLHNKLQLYGKLQLPTRQINSRVFHCDIQFHFKDGSEAIKGIEGEGQNKKAAEQAALLHLLAHFHQEGMMLDLFGSTKDFQLDSKTLATEADAKLDIYNYAARFGCVPIVTIESTVKRRAAGKVRSIVAANVTLSEQNINVTGRGLNTRSAEIAAALKFKEAAEQYQARTGSGSIVIKDSNALTTTNARHFFDFYKIVHPSDGIEVVTRSAKSRGRANVTEGQVVINEKPVGCSVQMENKKRAEDLAYLTAAIEITKNEPAIFPRFLKALKAGNGQILRPLAPATMKIEQDCLLAMQDTLLQARDAGLPDEVKDLESDEDYTDSRRGGFGRRPLEPADAERKSSALKRDFIQYLEDPLLEDLRKRRSELPMNQYLTKVIEQVETNTYSIIIGATGSGKTTQVPQILLERAIAEGEGATCNIICTQPRRIAATSVARRVAEERNEQLRDIVGYHVRFDAKLPAYGGSITYCTTGILLQQLQNSPDEVMDRISHLVIDEVHERDILIDFLMIILKKVMMQRIANGKPVPKVVLMSATMDADLFASYFGQTLGGEEIIPCPTLSVPGRTFPVKERFLEDIMGELTSRYSPSQLSHLKNDRDTRYYTEAEERFANANSGKVQRSQNGVVQPEDFAIDWKQERKVSSSGTAVVNEKEEALVPHVLIAATVAHVVKTTSDGAILVFLPGLDDIVKVNEQLTQVPVLGTNFNDQDKFKFFLLHSSMPAGQTEVFEPPPPGIRKIILATNIAETSITIPDVQHVIDSGKLREKRYDQARRITQLQCTWISKSNSKQRAGRAGRVQNGNYYALFSNERYQTSRAIGLPEMLRTDLQEICLDIKAQAFKSPVREFLAAAIEPPPPEAVDASVDHLIDLDAFTEDEKITPLGRLLAALPVHPSLGKMIVLGVMFRCLDPMIVLGAAAAERNIFLNPLEAKREARQAKLAFVQGSGSDHITLLNAIRQLRVIKAEHGEFEFKRYCHDNFIHANAFKTIESTSRQVEDILVESGLVPRISPFDRANYQYGDGSLNENSNSVPLIKALLLAGTHPNFATSTGSRTFRTPGEKNVIIHPGSVNASAEKGAYGERANPHANHFIYSVLARANDGNSMMLRDSTEVTPLMATLFGGKLRLDRNIIEIDDWLPFYVRSFDRRAARIVVEFRKALERLYAETFTDLATKRRSQDHRFTDRKSYLADNEIRSIFAAGLVDIFKKDYTTDEYISSSGYGANTLPRSRY